MKKAFDGNVIDCPRVSQSTLDLTGRLMIVVASRETMLYALIMSSVEK